MTAASRLRSARNAAWAAALGAEGCRMYVQQNADRIRQKQAEARKLVAGSWLADRLSETQSKLSACRRYLRLCGYRAKLTTGG